PGATSTTPCSSAFAPPPSRFLGRRAAYFAGGCRANRRAASLGRAPRAGRVPPGAPPCRARNPAPGRRGRAAPLIPAADRPPGRRRAVLRGRGRRTGAAQAQSPLEQGSARLLSPSDRGRRARRARLRDLRARRTPVRARAGRRGPVARGRDRTRPPPLAALLR